MLTTIRVITVPTYSPTIIDFDLMPPKSKPIHPHRRPHCSSLNTNTSPEEPFKLPKFKKPNHQPIITATPLSPTDDFESGVDFEEQGDRWSISDLSKSLRAYQRAYESYQRASGSGDRDVWYNYLRLIYHVFQIVKDVPEGEIVGVDGCTVVDMTLEDVKREYVRVVGGMFDGWLNWQCAFNEVLINTDVVEVGEISWDNCLKVVEESVGLIKRLLEFQLTEVDAFVRRLESGENSVMSESEGDGEDEGEFQMSEQITPSAVLETTTTGFKLVQTAFEFCEDREQIDVLYQGLEPLIEQTLTPTADLITGKFNPELNNELHVTTEEVDELRLTQQCVRALFITDFNELVSFWESFNDNSSSRYLAQADSYETYKSLTRCNSEEIWTIVTKVNQSLKTAQDLIQLELQDHRARMTSEVSQKVSKIVQVLIERADNELLRSQLSDYEPAVKNASILRQNCINLLKSALNTSQSNVGLREGIRDKLKREKLRRECIVRLVVLTKEPATKEDLERNLGHRWEGELADLRDEESYRYAVGKMSL